MWKKNKRLFILSVILIIIGFVPLVQGLLLISNIEKTEVVTIEGTKFSLDKLTSINLLPKPGEEDILVDWIKVNFDTMVIFEGDSVGLTATATGINEQVEAIAIIITDPNQKLWELSNKELGQVIEEDKKFLQVLELSRFSDPPFHTRMMVPFLVPNHEVMLLGVVLTENGLHRLKSDEVVTTVNPRIDKLQAETNRAILLQIEETKKETIEQAKTNNIILGLAWIGVSAIPILAGFNVVLRIYFKEN